MTTTALQPLTLGPTPMAPRLHIVIVGLTITSSWGNGHATTYRALVRELTRRGHSVLFLEHDKPWYAGNRDMPTPPWGRTELYTSIEDLQHRFASAVQAADLVIVGSYVPEGIAVGHWVTSLRAGGLTAFYDIDTPVTLAKLAHNACDYLSLDLVPRYHLYLSFTGGPTLTKLEHEYHSPRALPLYCSVDPDLYFPSPDGHEPSAISNPKTQMEYSLGYLGTYSSDRQPTLDRLLLQPAQQLPDHRFAVAGSLYPPDLAWPANVIRIEHLPPSEHRAFYNRQHFTLNVTRADMIAAGYSPSVRIFEAAACGTPIISDPWPGLETFLTPNDEILLAHTADDTLHYLRDLTGADRQRIAVRARARILAHHTAAHRAAELESYILHPAPH